MRTIHKAALPRPGTAVSLWLPGYAGTLHVGPDGTGVPSVWYQVETNRPAVLVNFVVVGTGHPMPDGDGWVHAGSFTEGAFVAHVFYRRQE